jgi:hypothetical protein
MTTTIKITRKDLYNLVWSEPMIHVAKRYRISNVGMAKICRKHNIPRPPRGYWAKKEFGMAPAKTPLKNPGNNYNIEMCDPNERKISSPAPMNEIGQKFAGIKQMETPIKVSDTLRGSHEQYTVLTTFPDLILALPFRCIGRCDRRALVGSPSFREIGGLMGFPRTG